MSRTLNGLLVARIASRVIRARDECWVRLAGNVWIYRLVHDVSLIKPIRAGAEAQSGPAIKIYGDVMLNNWPNRWFSA